VREFGEDIRYVVDWEKWLIWDNTRWVLGETRIEHLAKSIPRLIKEEALLEPDYRKRTELDRWAFKSEFIRRLKAMIEMARSDPKIHVGFAELDADPLMLGVLNGVVDLKSGELLPADRSYYITKQAHVVFDKDGLCPKWLAFIDKVTGGDKEFARYLQRWMGYCLTGLPPNNA
jgi:putative DNA primase/helicase